MLSTALYSYSSYIGARLNRLDPNDTPFYDYSQPRIKSLLLNNYDWILSTYKDGRMRDAVLDNVLKTIICRTPYLGYDEFECPECGDWILIYRHCHSRFCTRCGVKLQRKLAAQAEVMCINKRHRHIVFTIPEQYRELFRTDRKLLDLLFIASRNTLMKVFNKNIFDKAKRKKQKNNKKFCGDKDNIYLMRNYTDINIFGSIATLHTFGRDLKWNPHIHALVPELVYNTKTEKCEDFHHLNFASLRKTWQYEVNRLLKDYYKDSDDTKLKSRINSLISQSFKNYDNGFYSNKEKDLLYKIHSQLGNIIKASLIKQEKKKELKRKLNQLKFRTLCADTFNRDILKCRCGGYYEYKDTYNPERKTSDRQYMLDCVADMRRLRPPGIYED